MVDVFIKLSIEVLKLIAVAVAVGVGVKAGLQSFFEERKGGEK